MEPPGIVASFSEQDCEGAFQAGCKIILFSADDEDEVDTADAGVTDRTTRLFQMVKDRDYDEEEEEVADDEDDGLMPLSEEPDEMKRVSLTLCANLALTILFASHISFLTITGLWQRIV